MLSDRRPADSLTRDSGIGHIVRAALEAVCYQTADLMRAMQDDLGGEASVQPLRVDGGMVANDWLCQYLADILARPVERPEIIETTALGVAYFAGLATGVYGSMGQVADAWRCQRRFEPEMGETNYIRLRFNPMIEIGLGARAKIPGEAMIGEQRELFLSNEFPDEMSPYERLLGDAMAGEGLLFARQDGVEEAWRVVDRVLTHHHVAHPYAKGTWGPKEADQMLARDGRQWRRP